MKIGFLVFLSVFIINLPSLLITPSATTLKFWVKSTSLLLTLVFTSAAKVFKGALLMTTSSTLPSVGLTALFVFAVLSFKSSVVGEVLAKVLLLFFGVYFGCRYLPGLVTVGLSSNVKGESGSFPFTALLLGGGKFCGCVIKSVGIPPPVVGFGMPGIFAGKLPSAFGISCGTIIPGFDSAK